MCNQSTNRIFFKQLPGSLFPKSRCLSFSSLQTCVDHASPFKRHILKWSGPENGHSPLASGLLGGGALQCGGDITATREPSITGCYARAITLGFDSGALDRRRRVTAPIHRRCWEETLSTECFNSTMWAVRAEDKWTSRDIHLSELLIKINQVPNVQDFILIS